MTPQFTALQEALTAGRAAVGGTTTEPDPELVAVFDLAGTVEHFMRAVAGIDGLEFLAELNEEQLDPDDEFYFERDGEATDGTVPETLYTVMSNARAVTELVRLFELWQVDPTVKFARGLNPLKQVFVLLRAVRRWGPADRVKDTHLLEAWAEDVATAGGQGFARIEVELWFRDDGSRRAAVQADVERLVTVAGGRVISTAVVESIDYHALLADLPYDQVEAVLANGPDAIELLTTESIMFVSAARPMTVPSPLGPAGAPAAAALGAPSNVEPRVALLDGVPLTNHAALAGRLILDDPDGRAARYTSGQQHHGTAMASLISHGDLSEPGPVLSTQIYVRPIMEPHEHFVDNEVVAKDELLADVVHRAFRRMFEGEGAQPAAAPSVRIVNLSIGDPARVFVRRLSPLAKLLDWLAHRYNLVVLVSAGNHPTTFSVTAASLDDLETLRAEVLSSGYEEARHRGLLSPAEAVNVLTVGALHTDAATTRIPDTALDAIGAGMPAGYSAVGFGHRRSVKPEILFPGGRQLLQRPPPGTTGDFTLREVQTPATGPGLLVAAPAAGPILDNTAYRYGTSNSTALGTRAANMIFDVLTDLSDAPDEFPFPDAQYHPVLAKTLLVHAANWGDLPVILRRDLALDPRTARRALTQLLGYGPVDPTRLATASRTRAVLLGAGSITHGERHAFSYPLPPALRATTDWRRLTITLGWLSPINARSQRHRMARLMFEPPRRQLALERTEADHNAVRKGTVQHEVLEGRAAVAFNQDDALTVNIDCRIDAGRLELPVRYGLAVSLEVGATINADIHAEVRQLLRVQLRQRVATRTRA